MINRNKLAAVALAASIAAAATGTVMAQAAAKPAGQAQAAQAKAVATPESVFNTWDKDKNKALSLDEFRSGWTEIQMRQTLGKLHQNFVAMDTNKNGGLDQTEFANLEMIKKAGSKAPMMTAFDADKSGKLEFKEYVELIGSIMKNNK